MLKLNWLPWLNSVNKKHWNLLPPVKKTESSRMYLNLRVYVRKMAEDDFFLLLLLPKSWAKKLYGCVKAKASDYDDRTCQMYIFFYSVCFPWVCFNRRNRLNLFCMCVSVCLYEWNSNNNNKYQSNNKKIPAAPLAKPRLSYSNRLPWWEIVAQFLTQICWY